MKHGIPKANDNNSTHMQKRAQEYFAAGAEAQAEKARLDGIAALYDARVQRQLTTQGIAKGARVLEVGYGSGTMLRWLAEQVGPGGHVVGLDVTDRCLDRSGLSPQIEIREGDVEHLALERASYDLVYGRLILEHLQDPSNTIARLVQTLRPGGVLAFFEVHGYGMHGLDPDHPLTSAFDSGMQAVLEATARIGAMDAAFGPKVKDLLVAAGVTHVQSEILSRDTRGESLGARVLSQTIRTMARHSPTLAVAAQPVLEALQRTDFRYRDFDLYAAFGRRDAAVG